MISESFNSIVGFAKLLICMIGIFFITACGGSGDKSDHNDKQALSPALEKGQAIVKKNCKVCHAQGINGAPVIGNKKMWASRAGKSAEVLAQNASNGIGLMPPKGGHTNLSDEDILLAVQYMLKQIE